MRGEGFDGGGKITTKQRVLARFRRIHQNTWSIAKTLNITEAEAYRLLNNALDDERKLEWRYRNDERRL